MTVPNDVEHDIHSTAQACLYPELSVDIGTEAPNSTQNAIFLQHLNERLHHLFDILHENQLTSAIHPDSLSLQTRVSLTLLYCEQTAKFGNNFRSDVAELQQNVSCVLEPRISGWLKAGEKHDVADAAALIAAVLAWYKERVTVARWRRQAGATCGLARFAVVSISIRFIKL